MTSNVGSGHLLELLFNHTTIRSPTFEPGRYSESSLAIRPTALILFFYFETAQCHQKSDLKAVVEEQKKPRGAKISFDIAMAGV